MHSSLPSGPPFKLRSSLVAESRPRFYAVNHTTNQPYLLPQRTFYFTQRTGKLDVRRISRLNLEQIIEDVDIEALQQHLENVTFSSLNEEAVSQFSDETFLKLFRLAQLILEYLLSVQDTLTANMESLMGKNRALQDQCGMTQDQLKGHEEIINSLRMEVRQKRRTIERYEQLMAVPREDEYDCRRIHPHDESGVSACHTCGKLFTSQEFLQEHIVRKHAVSEQQQERENHFPRKEKTRPPHTNFEETAATPKQQLQLHALTTTGNCVQVFVSLDITVGRLKEHIGGAGIACSRLHRLLFRGTALSNDTTIRDTSLSDMSQVLVLPPLHIDDEEKTKSFISDNGKQIDELKGSEQFTAALVTLMQQQQQQHHHLSSNKPGSSNNLESEGGIERAIEINATEALERRMKQMELSMPQKVEAMLEEGTSDAKGAIGALLVEVMSHCNKKSAASTIEEDDDNVLRHNKSTIQSSESSLASRKNERVLSAVANFKQHNDAKLGLVNNDSSDVRAAEGENKSSSGGGGGGSDLLPPGHWLLTFEADGEHPHIQMEVTKSMVVVADVLSFIASMLDDDEERVSLVVANIASPLHSRTPVYLLRHYYGSGNIELQVASSHRSPISDCCFVYDEILENDEKNDNIPLNHHSKQQSTLLQADVTVEGEMHPFGVAAASHTQSRATTNDGDIKAKAVEDDTTTLIHEEDDAVTQSNTTGDVTGTDSESHKDANAIASDEAARGRKRGNNRTSPLLQQHATDNAASSPTAASAFYKHDETNICKEKYAESPTEDDDDNYSSIPDSTGGYDTMDNSTSNQIDFQSPDFNKTEETDFSVFVNASKRADFYEDAASGG